MQVGIEYETFTGPPIPAGAIMFIGTDGIWEARNPSGELFGKERLRDVIRANSAKSVDDIAAALEKAISQFIGDERIHDDITYVVVKFRRS